MEENPFIAGVAGDLGGRGVLGVEDGERERVTGGGDMKHPWGNEEQSVRLGIDVFRAIRCAVAMRMQAMQMGIADARITGNVEKLAMERMDTDEMFKAGVELVSTAVESTLHLCSIDQEYQRAMVAGDHGSLQRKDGVALRQYPDGSVKIGITSERLVPLSLLHLTPQQYDALFDMVTEGYDVRAKGEVADLLEEASN